MTIDVMMAYAYGHIKLLIKMIGDSCKGEDKPVLRLAVIYFLKLKKIIDEVIEALLDEICTPEMPGEERITKNKKKKELADLSIESKKEDDFEIY